jgi:hypothetical protein
VRDALRDDVVINALDAKGLYTDGPGRPFNDTAGVLPLPTFFFDEMSKMPRQQEELAAMANFAVSTGGLLFQNNNDLTLGFRRLGLAPSASYELAFSPKHLVRNGKMHALKVELDPPIKGATIEARRGYLAPGPGPSSETLERRLAAAVRAVGPESALAIAFSAKAFSGGIAVNVSITTHDLTFASVNGRHAQALSVVAGLFDEAGRFVSGERGEVTLALKAAAYRHFRSRRAKPLRAAFTLHAPAGKYRLRVVVQQVSDGRMAAASKAVRIR